MLAECAGNLVNSNTPQFTVVWYVLYGNEESLAHVYENPGRKTLIRTATGIVFKFLVVGIINCYKRQRSFSFRKDNIFYDFKYFYCASLFFFSGARYEETGNFQILSFPKVTRCAQAFSNSLWL